MNKAASKNDNGNGLSACYKLYTKMMPSERARVKSLVKEGHTLASAVVLSKFIGLLD